MARRRTMATLLHHGLGRITLAASVTCAGALAPMRPSRAGAAAPAPAPSREAEPGGVAHDADSPGDDPPGDDPPDDDPPGDDAREAEPRDDDDDDDDDDEGLLNEVVGASAIYPQRMAEIQFNLELGYLEQREDRRGDLGYAIEIGATDWWQFELRLIAPSIRGGSDIDTEVGLGEVELETQFTWMHMRGSPFSGALSLGVELPLGNDQDDEEDGEGVTYEPMLLFAVDPPGGRAQVFTNLGVQLGAEAPTPQLSVGVIGAASLTRPYLVASVAPQEQYLIPGVSLILPKDWELVMGIPVGLSRTSAIVGAGLVLIYEIDPLERRRQRRRTS